MLDLSKFKQSFVKDKDEEIDAIASMKSVRRIGEGAHEVKVIKIHEKDGQKLKMVDKLGGTIGFSLVVQNPQQEEQMVFLSVPLAVTFIEAAQNKEHGFQFRNTVQILRTIGIDIAAFREAFITTNGEAVELLIGSQFMLINAWPNKKIHLEYDSTAKAHYFVDSMNKRFHEGEMSLPIMLDSQADPKERFAPAVSIAFDNGYELAMHMNTTIKEHPTATNEHINEELLKICTPQKKLTGFVSSGAPKVINRTVNASELFKKSALPVTE